MQQDGFFFLVRHHLIPPFLPQLREVHLVFLFFIFFSTSKLCYERRFKFPRGKSVPSAPVRVCRT